MKHILIACAVLATMPLAQAGPIETKLMFCSDTAKVENILSNKFHEVPVGLGITHNRDMVRLFTSDQQSFTVVVTHPNGISCVLLEGTNWENQKAPIPGKET